MSNTFNFLNDALGLDSAQAIVFLMKNKNDITFKKVNLLFEEYITSYPKLSIEKFPLLIINNSIEDSTPIRERVIKKKFQSLKDLKKRESQSNIIH